MKEIHELIHEIDRINLPKHGIIRKSNSPLHEKRADYKCGSKGIEIEFEWEHFSFHGPKPKDVFKKLNFISESYHLVFEGMHINWHSPPKCKGSIVFFYSKGFSKSRQYYFRAIIPLTKEIRHWYFVASNEFQVNDEKLKFHIVSDEKKNYFLCIESNTKQLITQFEDKVFALKIALGYLTGHFAGGHGYFFAYSKKAMIEHTHFYRVQFRASIHCSYTPINSNPYSRIRNLKVAQRYYEKKKLRPLNGEEFSNLVQKLYDSDDFSSTIILMLESCAASLLFMPGGLAIVFESLANLIVPEKKVKTSLMPPSLSRRIRNECIEIIKKHKKELDEFSEHSFDELTKKIQNGLNTGTNKARLRIPFELLNIHLMNEDLKILDARNEFLHGRIPDFSNSGENRSINLQNQDLYYASMRSYTLISMIILKWIGYDNFVLNHPKIQEKSTGIKLKESHYRKV